MTVPTLETRTLRPGWEVVPGHEPGWQCVSVGTQAGLQVQCSFSPHFPFSPLAQVGPLKVEVET